MDAGSGICSEAETYQCKGHGLFCSEELSRYNIFVPWEPLVKPNIHAAPGRAKVQLDLTQQEAVTGAFGITEFLTQGLKIQETQ
jgi:hypothetical protein